MSTAVVYDPLYLEHEMPGHPESPGRLQAIVKALDAHAMWASVSKLEARPISLERLYRVHTPDYVRTVQDGAESGGASWRGGETYVSRHSYAAALLAAGGLVNLVEAVIAGEVDCGFALVRPPGHHAWADVGEGFCLFNNIAVAARTARDELGAQRVLIVDFDLHHGQGTQYTFEDDPSVFYFSTHQWGIYPGSGHFNDIGAGPGKGFTANVPLPAGTSDAMYLAVFDEVLAPLARRFGPDIILVSAGFDAHWRDPLGSMQVSVSGYAQMTRRLMDWAADLCQGRLVFTLEGGYDHDALAYGTLAVLNTLLNVEVVDPLGPSPAAQPAIDHAYLEKLKDLHGIKS